MDRRSVFRSIGAGLLASMMPAPAFSAGGRNLVGYIRTNWSRDPFYFGSYSYVARGARQSDRRTIEAPIDYRIFFAGEAVYPDYNSTVHAAYESGQRTAEFVSDRDPARVAIVGAGMSGLSAANRLASEGIGVTVIEARDRIGGRVWTDDRLGFPLDLGASWVHGVNGNPLIPLSDAAGQQRIATDDSYAIRGAGGQLIADSDAPDWLEDIVSIQHDAGADIDQINWLAYMLQDDYDGDEVIFPNGFAPIFSALAGDYAVELSMPVDKVQLVGGGGVALNFQNRAQETFDAVIVTLPLGVLKHSSVTFDPPLPAEKRDAIARLGMGTLDKLYLQFDAPFWDTDVTWIITPENGLPPGHFNQWFNLYPDIGVPVILAFNGGTPALDLADLPDDTLIERAVRTLDGAYPG